MNRPKATCPHCDRIVLVNMSGRFRVHRGICTSDVCRGAGTVAVSYVEDPMFDLGS